MIEKSSEVVTRSAEDLQASTEASGVLTQLVQFGNHVVVTLREQEHVLKANIRVETGNDERRGLDRWLAPPHQMHARNEPMIGCEGKIDGGS